MYLRPFCWQGAWGVCDSGVLFPSGSTPTRIAWDGYKGMGRVVYDQRKWGTDFYQRQLEGCCWSPWSMSLMLGLSTRVRSLPSHGVSMYAGEDGPSLTSCLGLGGAYTGMGVLFY